MTRAQRTDHTRQRLPEDVESEARIANLESLYDAGQYVEAVALGESICGLAVSGHLRGQIALLLALAYIQLGRPDPARAPLAQAREHFEAIPDAEMTVECCAAEAALACLEQRPEALQLAMHALKACRSLKTVPRALEVRILSSLASAQLVAGQMSDAIRTFEEAIKRTDPVVDMRRLGRLLGNAGVAYHHLGQREKAVRCSTRAVALFQTLDDVVSLAREENNLGYYLIASGELTSARRHLERSLDLFEKTNLRSSRSLLLLSLCELSLAEGDLEQAIAHADAAIDAGESQDEPWSTADARMWKGRLLERRGDNAGADDEFQRAQTILENAPLTDRLAECHAGYAEMLERRGDLPGAYAHLKAAFHISAGRSHNCSDQLPG